MGKGKRTKKTNISLLSILIYIVFGITFLIFINMLIDYRNLSKEADVLNHKDITSEEIVSKDEYSSIVKPYRDLNSDVIGVLEISGIQIKYPILKGSDNSFYLDRNINKEIDKRGSIYLDYINEPDFSDVNSVIYGHSMKDHSMFGGLYKFRNQEFVDSNSIIKIYTDKKLLKYQIFSVYVIEPDYPYRIKEFNSNDEIEKFLINITSKSEIKSNIKPTIDDKILTLSTCAYDFYDARLAVHAVLINE